MESARNALKKSAAKRALANEDIRRAFAGWRAEFRRDAWRPVTGSTPAAHFINSRFGGPAMVLVGEPWPRCGECQAPLHQFLQINLRDLPKGVSGLNGEGVLQLFRCVAVHCDDHEPFSESQLIRIVSEDDLRDGLRGGPAAPDGHVPLPQRTIRSWERIDDYPSVTEHERCGIEYDHTFEPGVTITTVRWPNGGVVFEGIRQPNTGEDALADAISPRCARFDKLGGWPSWGQGVEYPACPNCGAEMSCVVQLASEDNLPISLGDLGVGHISQCPKHPAVLAFAWASA